MLPLICVATILKHELAPKLEKARVDGVALIGHRPSKRDCVGADIVLVLPGLAKLGVVQHVEGVGTELQVIAFSPHIEFLEQRRVQPPIAGPGNIVLGAAEERRHN